METRDVIPGGGPAPAPVADWIPAREAAGLLGVKLPTLYSYVSRGLVRSVGAGGRDRRYARADVTRLLARQRARSGHGPTAAGALRWGEPVLATSVASVDDRGPVYRGIPAVELVQAGVGFEQAAELLWTGQLPAERPEWPVDERPLTAAGAGVAPLSALLAHAASGATAPVYGAPDDVEHARGRALLTSLPRVLAATRRRRASARRGRPAGSVAEALLRAYGVDASSERREAIDAALVLVADHELNVSTFATRVVASSGADLYACLAAGFAAVSGPRHGGMCDRVEALLDEVATPARAARVLKARLARGEEVPGFGHPLYPHARLPAGDPRAAPLLERAFALGRSEPRVLVLRAVLRAMAAAGHEPPTVDLGLVAVSAAVGLGPGAAAALFGVGRCAGWIAHALEQRSSGTLIRPRAGPPSASRVDGALRPG